MSESHHSDKGTTSPPPSRPPRPPAVLEQSPRQGRRLGTVGWLAITLSSVLFGFSSESAPVWEHWAQWGAGLVLVVAGVWAVLRGRRHLTQVLTSPKLLPADERIVLFLRGFSDDKGFSRVNARRVRRVLSESPVTPADVRTEEDQVARAVAPFGQMVALGNPKDKLPPPGVPRKYASDKDKEWQDEVLGALNRADLVVLAAGAGGGLDWEVDQVVHRNDPTRLLLVVSRDRRQYAQFRESFQDRFLQGLPDYPAGIRQRILRGRYVRAVIWFDSDWTPHLEMLDGRFALIGLARRTQRALRRVLRPVYQRAGVPARVAPTMARPWAVNLSVALIVTFWLSPIIGLSALLIADPLALWPLWFLLIAGLAWVYRVWRGGPIAITMARIQGLYFPIFVLALAVSLALSSQGQMVFPILVILVSGLEAAHLIWLLYLGLALLALGTLGMPTTTLLLIRHNVREWIDSRL